MFTYAFTMSAETSYATSPPNECGGGQGDNVPQLLLELKVRSRRRLGVLLLIPWWESHHPPLSNGRCSTCWLGASNMPRIMSCFRPSLQHLIIARGLLTSADGAVLQMVPMWGSCPLGPWSGSPRHSQPRCAPVDEEFTPHLQPRTQTSQPLAGTSSHMHWTLQLTSIYGNDEQVGRSEGDRWTQTVKVESRQRWDEKPNAAQTSSVITTMLPSPGA